MNIKRCKKKEKEFKQCLLLSELQYSSVYYLPEG